MELVFATVKVPLSGSLVSVPMLITPALPGRNLIGLVGVAVFQILGLHVGVGNLETRLRRKFVVRASL